MPSASDSLDRSTDPWRALLAGALSGSAGQPTPDPAGVAAIAVARETGSIVWVSPSASAALGREFRAGEPAPEALARAARVGPAEMATSPRLIRVRLGAGPLGLPVTLACTPIRTPDGDSALLVWRPTVPAARPLIVEESGETAGAAPASSASPDCSPSPPVVAATDEPVALETRRRPVRFTWRTGADGRFVAFAAGADTGFAPESRRLVGLDWSQILGIAVSDPAGVTAAATTAGQPFGRIMIDWRGADDALVPVELGGMPIGPSAEGEGGWRGFGLAFPDESRPAPPGYWRDSSEPGARTGSSSAPAEAPHPTPPVQSPFDVATAMAERAGETAFSLLQAWLGAEPTRRASAGPQPSMRVGPVDSERSLSAPERGALHEIARALSGMGEADDGDPAPDRPSAEIVPLTRRSRDPEAGQLLDRIPVPVLALREGTPLFANRSLLDHLGAETLPDAVARNILAPLLALDPRGPSQPGQPLDLPGIAGNGPGAKFRVATAPVPWGDGSAQLLTLVPTGSGSDLSEPEVAAGADLPAAADVSALETRVADLTAGLDGAADGFILMDPDGRVTALSARAERLFRVESVRAIGDGLTALLAPDTHRAALSCLQAAVRVGAGNRHSECEVRPRSAPGGAPGRLLTMRAVSLDPERGYAALFTDAAIAPRIEAELRDARAAAEQTAVRQGDFLARVSHEVRTPVTAIVGFAELMLEERFGPVGSDRYRGYIRDIQESGNHVVSLINDLLDLAKVTSGRSELSPTAIDLNAVAQRCVEIAAPISARERTVVRTSLGMSPALVRADERSVRQVILNILTNAIRYTGAGGQVIVSTRATEPGQITLTIRDTGPGMNESEIQEALTPFRQVASTRRVDGTGLGLPLSKALVEANGGTFRMTSARSAGTIVEIRLPVAAGPGSAVAAE